MRNAITSLRRAGLAEAISFILLVAVAMPLKYIWARPQAVSIVGMIHGILFVVFCAALLRVMLVCRWPLSRGAFVFVMALLPFGPFLIDQKLRGWAEEPVRE